MARSLAALAAVLLLASAVSAADDDEESTIPSGLFNFKALADAEMDPARFNGTQLGTTIGRPSDPSGGAAGNVIEHPPPTSDASNPNNMPRGGDGAMSGGHLTKLPENMSPSQMFFFHSLSPTLNIDEINKKMDEFRKNVTSMKEAAVAAETDPNGGSAPSHLRITVAAPTPAPSSASTVRAAAVTVGAMVAAAISGSFVL